MISNKSGRNASNPRLACPPQLKSINTDTVVFIYIPQSRVSESIQFDLRKSKKKRKKTSVLLVLLLEFF
jgi:hypothetical protein